jgi:methenyltetrahydromethanopterin cyclohydrolase
MDITKKYLINGPNNVIRLENGEKVIYFSETVPDDLQEELTDIFYGISQKYSGPHQAVFEDLDWTLEKVESFIFGQLEVKELKEEELASYK